RSDWTVTEAADGAQALRAALESPPDVAVLDVSMPGLDGCAVCRALRGDPRTRGVAVLLLTGAPGEDLQRLDPPPDAWLAKPFPLTELVAKAVELLKMVPDRRAPVDSERCDACGIELSSGRGRFRRAGRTLCLDCGGAESGSAASSDVPKDRFPKPPRD
ncbi:MAG: response regulator, partial [Elusimicrobia bacterium]|nr:response regulator [Elusimicrobiota bacterium]